MKVLVILCITLAVVLAEPPAYRQQNQQQRRYYFARQEEETTPSTPAEAPYPASGWKPAGPSFDLPQRQLEDSYTPSRSFGSRTPAVEQQYGAPDSQADVQQQEEKPQQQQRKGQQEQQQQRKGQQEQQQQQQQQQQRFGSLQFQDFQRQQQQQFAASKNQFQQRQYLAPQSRDQTPINQYGVPQPQEQFQPPQPDQQYGTPFTTTEEPSTTTEIEDSTTTAVPQTDSEVEPVNSVNELDEEGDLDEQQSEQQDRQRGEYYVALPDGRLQRIRYVSHQDLEAMKYFARIRAENVEPLRGPIYSYAPLQELQFAPGGLRLASNPVAPSFPSSSVTSSAASSSASSGKLELQEEAAPSPPLAAVVQYAYDTPSAVIPLSGSSSYSANYRAPAPEARYIISLK